MGSSCHGINILDNLVNYKMKFLKQIANLFVQLKAVAGAIVVVSVIVGATVKLTKVTNNNSSNQDANFDRMFDSIAVVKELAEFNNIEIGFQGEQLYNINDSLEKMAANDKKQSEDIKSLTWVVKNRSKYDQAQLDAIMDEMLKKNTSMQRIEMEWPQWMTQQPSTDLIRAK